MMVILYKTDVEIANKRKMKSLWDKKPDDWPPHVPFKDPNNGVKLENGRHGQKPVHRELLQMYQFLKKKYLKDVKIINANQLDFENVKEESLPEKCEYEMNLRGKAEAYPDEEEMSEASHDAVSFEHQDSVEDKSLSQVEPSLKPLHPLLNAQYQRLAENFNEVNNMVIAYCPGAANDLENLGKELECLFEETKYHPDRFSLITNEIGHKTESFLGKAQMLHLTYIMSSAFTTDCQVLTNEIIQRMKACNAIQPQSLQVGIVMDASPTLSVKSEHTDISDTAKQHTIYSLSKTNSVLDSRCIQNIEHRTNNEPDLLNSPDKSKSQNTSKLITKDDLSASLKAVDTDSETMAKVLDIDSDKEASLQFTEIENQDDFFKDILDMEAEYGVPQSNLQSPVEQGHLLSSPVFSVHTVTKAENDEPNQGDDMQNQSNSATPPHSVNPSSDFVQIQDSFYSRTSTSQADSTDRMDDYVTEESNTEPQSVMEVYGDHESDHMNFNLHGMEEII